jgi:hypothetical protein
MKVYSETSWAAVNRQQDYRWYAAVLIGYRDVLANI